MLVMEEKIFKEIILSISPYTISVRGDGPRMYFLRVHRTETDFLTSAGLAAAITRHIITLSKLRAAVEEAV